ncbi:MAG: calcineurin-like phosphoesterase C-terminal domain-containing protein, partial [Gemmatimonadota bacterium]|nr:calcineurin-like phosphoesterase C-terminal domain-containing protein [Gemmatimonadota bacterium]
PLPASIDFPLHRLSARETRFTAHAFADPQARSDLDEDMLREELVNTLLGNPYQAEFSITVGDVVFDNLGLYDRHKEMMGLIGVPQWNLPGNHDMNLESPNAQYANETFKKHFGPTYYSFNYGNAHVVALNNVEYAGAEQGGYRGFISDDQIRWLEQDLAHVPRDMLIVIATHISLISEASDGDPSHDVSGPRTDNFDRLLELLRPFDNIYGLAGHDTSNSWKVEIDHEHGWTGQPWIAHTLAEVRGSGWTRGPRDLRGVADAMMEDGNPNGFYLLKFDDVTLVPEFIPFPFGQDAGQGLRIVLDPELEPPTDGGINRGVLRSDTKVVVNLFDGGERDRVRLSLDGGPLMPMRYVVRTDPFVERAYALLADTPEAFPGPAVSAHIWEFDLPDDVEAGLHSLVVESEDEFGQRHRGVLSFEVMGAGR